MIFMQWYIVGIFLTWYLYNCVQKRKYFGTFTYSFRIWVYVLWVCRLWAYTLWTYGMWVYTLWTCDLIHHELMACDLIHFVRMPGGLIHCELMSLRLLSWNWWGRLRTLIIISRSNSWKWICRYIYIYIYITNCDLRCLKNYIKTFVSNSKWTRTDKVIDPNHIESVANLTSELRIWNNKNI